LTPLDCADLCRSSVRVFSHPHYWPGRTPASPYPRSYFEADL